PFASFTKLASSARSTRSPPRIYRTVTGEATRPCRSAARGIACAEMDPSRPAKETPMRDHRRFIGRIAVPAVLALGIVAPIGVARGGNGTPINRASANVMTLAVYG